MSNQPGVRRVKLCDAVKSNCFVSVNSTDDNIGDSGPIKTDNPLLSASQNRVQHHIQQQTKSEQNGSPVKTPTSSHHVHFESESDKCPGDDNDRHCRPASVNSVPADNRTHDDLDGHSNANLAMSNSEQRPLPVKNKFTAFRRTRSLNAPSPICQFGPCGSIKKNSSMVMTIQDPATQRLTWNKAPGSVLVIKKIHDSLIIQPFLDLVQWLIWEKRMSVFVEASVLEDAHLKHNPLFVPIKERVRTFRDGKDDLTDRIDFIVCLGGDGTLLYASSIFQESVPPVMAFHMGSLGFLTPFEFENFQQQINNVLRGNAALTLRSRLRCLVVRSNNSNAITNGTNHNHNNDGTLAMNGTAGTGTGSDSSYMVLNEVVIDRGPSPYLSNVDLYIDGKHITTVQGDGLIISTPTGSTAYAVAAGASMIHPSVPAIMITPICPHSLSFRPIVVPAGVELKVCVSPDSRNSAWVSFDGRSRQEIEIGDQLRVTMSIYPLPSICAEDQITDWFESLAECLHWNVRQKQKQFDEFSDLIHSSSSDSLDK